MALCLSYEPSNSLEIACVVVGENDDCPEAIEGWYIGDERPAMNAKLVP